MRDEVLQRRARFKEDLTRFAEHVEAELASALRELLRDVVHDYEALKARAGWLDFTDLLLRTRELLVRDAPVRTAWQRSFSHLFVDEFQDTDPLQADILLLLASDPDAPLPGLAQQREAWRLARVVPGKLFVVGDPKQSIYRFRRADVRIYEGVKRHLAAGGAAVLYLSTSFRSLPGIQALVNAAFAPTMLPTEDGTQARYVPLEPFRVAGSAQPAVIALPAPRARLWREGPVKGSVEESLPDAVGAFIAWLVSASGWTVEEAGKRVPVAPRHVCLLFKSLHSTFKEDPVRGYVDALERRQVPHVLMGGRTFHDREEVGALRQALAALEWPDDELAVYATLHGPFFALNDDALLAYKDTLGHLSPVRRVEPEALLGDEQLEAVQAALDVLRRLHARRNRRPIAETLGELLAETRAHASLAFWPSGEQALANILRVVDHGRRFDARGTTSFRAFVTWLEGAADTERGGGNAPIVEEGAEGVRVMTVHKAKGLEFPVVILCSPTENAAWSRPSRFVDPEQGLAVRSLAGCLPITSARARRRSAGGRPRRGAAPALRGQHARAGPLGGAHHGLRRRRELVADAAVCRAAPARHAEAREHGCAPLPALRREQRARRRAPRRDRASRPARGACWRCERGLVGPRAPARPWTTPAAAATPRCSRKTQPARRWPAPRCIAPGETRAPRCARPRRSDSTARSPSRRPRRTRRPRAGCAVASTWSSSAPALRAVSGRAVRASARWFTRCWPSCRSTPTHAPVKTWPTRTAACWALRKTRCRPLRWPRWPPSPTRSCGAPAPPTPCAARRPCCCARRTAA
jgi:superfamily I DNA/RNA helicase